MLWLNPKKTVSIDMDVAKVLSPQAAKKINGNLVPIRSGHLCLCLSFSISFFLSHQFEGSHFYIKPPKTFFHRFYAVAAQNVCLSHCGCIRLSENRECEQKASTIQRRLLLSKEIVNIPNKEMQLAGPKCDIFQFDFYFTLCIAFRLRFHREIEKQKPVDCRWMYVRALCLWIQYGVRDVCVVCMNKMHAMHRQRNIELQKNRNSYSIMPSLCLCP